MPPFSHALANFAGDYRLIFFGSIDPNPKFLRRQRLIVPSVLDGTQLAAFNGMPVCQKRGGSMQQGAQMRTVAIWMAGLLASGIFGWLIDAKFLSTTTFPDGGPGLIGGMLAFVCVRLWLTTPSEGQGLGQY